MKNHWQKWKSIIWKKTKINHSKSWN